MSHPDTIAVHAGEPPLDREDAPITPDITVGSASGYPDLASLDAAMAEHRGYGRWGTENHRQLEAAVAGLEANGLDGALGAVAVGSGMAAIAVALMSEMNAGDHVVAAHDCYGTTVTFLREDLSRFGITSSIVDFQDLDAVKAAVTDRTRVLLCEICTNPLIRVPDLEALAEVAHQAGALLVVDNTVPTPALSQPRRWGADVVIYSATKNLSGHADVVGGVVVGKPSWVDGARAFAHTFGPTLGPFDAWLTLRGIRTLAVRMARHTSNALQLARFLESHPAVSRVHYPELESSPFCARARRFLPAGAGALLSFELAGGRPALESMLRRLRLVRLMPSLGNVITTLSHPASTSHRGLDPTERARAGISDGLVRCSVGLEHPDDLLEDFQRALTPS
ncbi:MAG TPA: aminotransferase class I/II-fold pyridoxal phosphate-dependent enzyme [Candidatus Dormibacteraeota bacterium]|jgi:cystathionine beta-lyase/cystathionine gamma-synthase|nr:aminotransferase class I/II-fold pyridoxal phosphate-dependent enzyme [Candidatus Dormibacteraeota bacterium]